MKPILLKIQNYYTQTGVGRTAYFMWKYGPQKNRQTAYQIDIYHSGSIVYSTGKIVSDEQNNIKLEMDLQEQTEYEFDVTAWDENDFAEKSDRAKFVTGIFNGWQGDWIGNGGSKPFIVRKSFEAEKNEKAVLSVCVPGQFEVKINGRKISAYAYEGSQTDFNKHVHYSTYDVTGFIRQGRNEVTIEVANGWYIGDDANGKRYFYTMNMGYEAFGDCLAVLAQLKLGEHYIVTDTTWEVSKSKTVLANIYGSEDIDNTIEYVWSCAGKVTAPKGEIIACNYPPVIHKYCYEAKCIDKERMIFDSGQNMSSQFFLKIKGDKGQKIKLIPAEKLSKDGDIEQTVDTYSILTLSGNEDVFEQRFSVNGARWYKIQGASCEQIIEFKVYFTTSSAEDVGYFHCSDEGLNRIYNMILRAIESNLNHSHTDCPTIEKLGWLEPNHLMARAVMFNKDVDMLWSKIAMDMRDAQYPAEEFDIDTGSFPHEYRSGLIPTIAPRYAKFTKDWNFSGSFWDSIPWGSSIILAAYEQYCFYGNKQVLEDNYEAALKYIEYLNAQYKDYNRLYNKEGDERFICAGLGDWGVTQNGGESRENVETAFFYHDIMIMIEISEILGREKAQLEELAEEVKANYNHSLLRKNPEDNLYCYPAYDTEEFKITQANQAIPLCFGLVPDYACKEVEESFLKVCGNHLVTGEIGLVYILRALSALGRNDIILNMITQSEHPSYLRFVRMGETTLPEFWRDDARSRNHDMMGHIMEWFFTEIAGIKSRDGFKTIEIVPGCTDFISEFECVYNSIRGEIKVSFKEGALHIQTPGNSIVSCNYNKN